MLTRERSGPIGVWTLNRPEKRNALSLALLEALGEAFDTSRQDTFLRAIVLTGAGDSFCSGGDLTELRTATSTADAERLSALGQLVCRVVGELDVPVIAALNGPAFGGGAELAIACDVRVASPNASLSFRHARMGTTTSWGSVARLVSLVGHGRASELLYTSAVVSAEDAVQAGLVEVLAEDPVAAAVKVGSEIALGGREAIAGLKHLLFRARPNTPTLDDERAMFVARWTSDEHKEAIAAYFEKRSPSWTTR